MKKRQEQLRAEAYPWDQSVCIGQGGFVKAVDLNAKSFKEVGDGFSYERAYSRSLGWLLPEELKLLSQVKVGIVGLGGVGGQYVEVLARLGVQNFMIADFDLFSVENTNRQNECRGANYHRNKADVMAELLYDINPGAQVQVWREGLRKEDIKTFCASIDIYLDGLDFFEVDVRQAIFREMRAQGKQAMTAAPVGSGTSFIYFDPKGMSFDDYFGIQSSDAEGVKYAKFLVGLDTQGHMSYLKDPSRLDLKNKKAPSLPMGVYTCASLMATSLLKIVLQRGELRGAPWVFHYDPYLLKSYFHYIFFGFKNPFQKLKVWLVLKRFASELKK